MFKKKIIIVGGSIAGCTSAVLLQRLGADVIILERSSGVITNQGFGITLPTTIIQQCTALDLFDHDIPQLPISGRSFSRTEDDEQNMRTFWKQPINASALNWNHVYQNLRSRIQSNTYYPNTEVRSIKKIDNIYHLTTATGITYQADLVIAADGVNSTVRKQILPEVYPKNSGYVAWRGLVKIPTAMQQSIFNEHVPYCVFPQGHILLYAIPDKNNQQTGDTLLNWVLYENLQENLSGDLLPDNLKTQPIYSLAPNSITTSHRDHLRALAQIALPDNIAALVCETQSISMQAVVDFKLPEYPDNQCIFVGDAAATLRPHTASGVFKALTNGIELATIFKAGYDRIHEITDQWKKKQQLAITEEVQKAKAMGDALVMHPPNWIDMDHASADAWWACVMQGKTWYATKLAAVPIHLNKYSIFKPANQPLNDNKTYPFYPKL